MTATTKARPGARKPVSTIDLPVKASTKILGGTIVCTDSSGWAVPATATPGLRPWGKAQATKDNTDGSNGALTVNVLLPHEINLDLWTNDTVSALVAGDRGKRAYLLDNQTLTAAVGTNTPGPFVYEVELGVGVWAWFEPAIGAPADVTAEEVLAPVRQVRGVISANVADLSAFTVASNDGLTYEKDQRVLLVAQTTPAQCGVYVVGIVALGVAPLTRAADMPAAAAVVPGGIIEVSEGTVFGGSSWKAFAVTGAIVGTNDPVYYPRKFSKVVTLSAGTYTIGASGGSEPLFLRSTTLSDVQATRDTAGGTITTTIMYVSPVASRIAGKAGTAAVEVRSAVAAGTILNTDTSTVNVLITNW